MLNRLNLHICFQRFVTCFSVLRSRTSAAFIGLSCTFSLVRLHPLSFKGVDAEWG